MSEQVKPAAPDKTQNVIDALAKRFGNVVQADDRDNFEGIVVDRDKLVEVAETLRDEYGYDYLANANAVDYLGHGDFFEMVYHCYRTEGGPALTMKSRTPRDVATLPSLVSVWRGADFQEREAYDLMGIHFTGHPNLKRILMWDGYEGHPLRKDWKEAYYEQDLKPFDSRWPGGDVSRAEEHVPFGRNVKYPEGYTLADVKDISEKSYYEGLNLGVDIEHAGGLNTDKLVVNLGPHHPSTHGVFRMVATLDGETVETLEPVMGYLHRNHEKIGERNTWIMNMPFTDRLDYITSMGNNHGYALAVEQMMEKNSVKGFSQPTERAELIRVLMVELTRYVSHSWAIGFLLNDLGAFFTPALYAIEERELILDFFEATAGSRLMCNYMRFGGLAKDIPDRIRAHAVLENDIIRDFDTMKFLSDMINERLPKFTDEFDRLLTKNELVQARTQGVGVLPPEMAIDMSVAGPVLRASGVPYDVRRADPYSIYPELDFDVAVEYNGDVYDRYLVRLTEMRESLKILQQVLPRIKETDGMDVLGLEPYAPRIPNGGEAYGRVENPKGELGYYVVGMTGKENDQNPWRYHVRSPSFINLTALEEMCRGHKVADLVVILGSIDIVLGEVDR